MREKINDLSLKIKSVTVLISFFLILFFVSCDSPSDSTPTPPNIVTESSQVENITIQFASDELREVTVETIPQNNCGGSAEVENLVEKSRNVSHSMEVSGELSISASGEVGIAGTGVELGAEVSSSLGYEYGTSENLYRSLTVKASPGTNMEHIISVQEVWKTGEAIVQVNNIEEQIPFSFRTDFKIELVDSKDFGCPTQQEEGVNVPTITLEPTPFNTPIPQPTSTPTTLAFDFSSSYGFESDWEFVGPAVTTSNESIILSSSVSSFPYGFVVNQPFPTQGDFSMELRFRYPSLTRYGVGLAVTNAVPPYGSQHNAIQSIFSIWQGSDLPLQLSFNGQQVFISPQPDTAWHVVRLDVEDNYKIYFDNQKVFTSPNLSERPSAMWIGNSVDLGRNEVWSSFEVDYIRVTKLH